MSDFITKDSGERVEFASGMKRDTDKGKPRYDLCDKEMYKRWAELMARGAEKYGANNWKQASSQEELDRFKSSAERHLMQWLNGDTDEDHGAAVIFNIAAAEFLKEKIKATVVITQEEWTKISQHEFNQLIKPALNSSDQEEHIQKLIQAHIPVNE